MARFDIDRWRSEAVAESAVPESATLLGGLVVAAIGVFLLINLVFGNFTVETTRTKEAPAVTDAAPMVVTDAESVAAAAINAYLLGADEAVPLSDGGFVESRADGAYIDATLVSFQQSAEDTWVGTVDLDGDAPGQETATATVVVVRVDGSGWAVSSIRES